MLFRGSIGLAALVALIPSNPADLKPGQEPVSALATLGVVQGLAGDVIGLCERRPETCETGRELVSQMSAKAQNGLRMVQAVIDSQQVDSQQVDSQRIDNQQTGSTRQAGARMAAGPAPVPVPSPRSAGQD